MDIESINGFPADRWSWCDSSPRDEERARRDHQSSTTRSKRAIVDDNELIQRISQRDTRAFEQLYESYHDYLRRFILRMNRWLEERVEEIINDVMLVVWMKADSFNHTSKVSTWILGIAYNKVLGSAKSEIKSISVDIDEIEPILPGVIDQGLREFEFQDWLNAAMDRLTPQQRALMELTCVQGLNYQEIAQILDCPENTVKTRMFNARKKLRQMLPEIGHHEEFE